MTTSADAVAQFEHIFNQNEKRLESYGGKVFSGAMRKNALQRVVRAGFPDKSNEDWRFTSLRPLLENRYVMPVQKNGSAIEDYLKLPHLLADAPYYRMVFVNGFYSERLSNVAGIPEGIKVLSLNSLDERKSTQIIRYFDEDKLGGDDTFRALNMSFAQDGALIEIPDNTILEKPVHLAFLSTNAESTFFASPRVITFVGKNSQATLIETFAGLSDNTYFNNTVNDIVMAENAFLKHYKVQNENTQSFHISNTRVRQNANSNYLSIATNFGGALVRNNIQTLLEGQGIETTLNGLYMGHGRQHIDNHTEIDHAMPHCNSWELYRGVLSDQARGVFSGKILVRPQAQKTDAKQSNNCLLLSDLAKIDSKPQLEIYADDVKCTHGATVGQLDKEALFYLRSRGIHEDRARNIMIYAFAEEVIEHIEQDELREYMDQLILERFKEDMNFRR